MKILLICLSLLLWLGQPARAQNLVLNGGFETGNFSSWTQFGDTGFSSVVTATSPEGTRHARMGPMSPGGIFQNIATTIGQAYHISYALSSGGSTSRTRTFLAQFGDRLHLTTLESLTNPALFSFTYRSFTFVATTTTSQIRFTFENDPNYWRLDNVVVKTPELNAKAAQLPVMLVMLILLIVFERRPRPVLSL
ncbi:carbohydrate binding domain-containing protein [bacterium]|nr:carbohydrate binding domain-containing protein [bacterium]